MLPWKCNELIVTQQELLRYYSNATKDLTCHNIYIYIYIYGWMDGQTDKWMDGEVDAQSVGWLEVWVGGYIDR
jgi:hypothetical protein